MRINPTSVRGIWPPLLLPWDKAWKLDWKRFDANLDRLIAAEPHGLYTLDTASEFFTLEFADWRTVARRFVRRCRQRRVQFPIGLGCTWTNQEGALRRICEARDLGVEIIHLSTPYWLPLNEAGVLTFLRAVQHEAGHLGMILYAPPHSKLRLTAALYRRIVAVAPCVIGTKTVGDDEAEMKRLLRVRPAHSHFVQECYLVARARLGARGCYSALAGISLPFMKAWWSMIERGDWPAAERRQAPVIAFYNEAVVPMREAGIIAGAVDKSMAQIGGAHGTRLIRPPYPSAPERMFRRMERAARKYLPEAFE
jgi:dihydrodipicolinate synthase/N-acetylneuraminate lyase